MAKEVISGVLLEEQPASHLKDSLLKRCHDCHAAMPDARTRLYDPSGKLCVFHSTLYFIPVHHIASLCCRLPLWYPDEQPLSFSAPFGRDLAASGSHVCGNGLHSGAGTLDLPLSHLVPPAPTAKSLAHGPIGYCCTAFGLIWLDS